MNNVSNLAKCTFCGTEMIERTNDNKLECLNCGKPFTMSTMPIIMGINNIILPHDIIDEMWCDEDDTL